MLTDWDKNLAWLNEELLILFFWNIQINVTNPNKQPNNKKHFTDKNEIDNGGNELTSNFSGG